MVVIRVGLHQVVKSLLLHQGEEITAVLYGLVHPDFVFVFLSNMSMFPTLSASASSKSSDASAWSKVSSGESKGVDTKAALFLCQDTATICMRCVGSSGLVVCCKPRGVQEETCGTKHNGEPFLLPEGRKLHNLVFVHDPRNKARFLAEPWADRSWFSDAALKVMSADYKSVPEWSEVFRIAQAKTYEDLAPATKSVIQDELDFVASAHNLTTPGRKESGTFEDYVQSSPFLSDQDIHMRNDWRADSTLPTGFLAHVEKMGDAIHMLMGHTEDHDQEESYRYQFMAEDLAKIMAWQDKTEARIGDPVPVFGREFASVWAALDYSVRKQEEASAAEILSLQKRVKEGEEKEEAMNIQFKAWSADVGQSFGNVKAHFASMATELKELREAQARSVSHGQGMESTKPKGRIQNGILFPPQDVEEPVDSGIGGGSVDEASMLGIIDGLRKRLSKLEVARAPGGGGGGDGPPHFGGLGLTCIEDLASWNMERGLSHYFGLFHDANSLLTFKRTEYVDAHDHVATLKRARDVGLNLIQAKLLVSFQNQVPLFFGKGTPTKGSSLNALPTARDWEEDDGTNGAKHDLDRALPSINKQLQSYIDVYLGDDQHEARALANRCLSQSILFIHKLSDFITRSYRTMTLLRYDPVKSWTFLMRQVKRIWEDIGRARACCVDIGSPTDPQEVGGGVFQNHNAALAMWGVLKAHDIMNEYLRHNFEDHPSIAAEQVRWVTRNVMSGEKGAPDSENKSFEGRLSKNEKAVTALKFRVDKDSSRLDILEKKG